MGPQPPSLLHTGASRRARRSPFADKTKGVWCRLPPQLLSRSFYAWLWPSFYWKLRTHSAARFLAAPDTETRFPCLQTRSGARNTWNHVQAQGKAQEIPRRSSFLCRARSREGDPSGQGVGIIAAWVSRTNCSVLHYCVRLARRVGLCSCMVDSANQASRSHMSQCTLASASMRSG